MLSLDQVTYQYPTGERPALRDLTLTIPAGQFCAVVGANGAGKSTLAYTLAGFVPHFYRGTLTGSVSVAGLDTTKATLADLVRRVGLVFQSPYNQISGSKFTVREEVAFGLENLGVPRDEMAARVAATLELVGIAALAERSPLNLSGGQMQRVALAAVLAMQPQVLVLDEPTSQLDPVGAKEVFSAVQALAAAGRVTVVMVEHKLEWVAAFAERVLVLADGALAADGPPTEVLAEAALAVGAGQTRYTQAARLARARGGLPAEQPLPVTLPQAVAAFGGRRA
ncbi:MAG: ABC transporter ATP-binding protein [Anaerolineales bacterium]|nr:ABC transporter ATP-binding protein [Anaerolineales bacterium]